SLVIGFTVRLPWLTVAAGTLGATMLIAGLVGKRDEVDQPATHDPARAERLVRVVTFGLVGLGLLAVLVALVVAEGEARGHAVFHLLTGFLCVGLFAALAFPWYPRAGGGAASLRGLVLTLLAVAALGAFMESLGGSGYDAANDGHRIEALTTLHSIAAPFGALIVAVPLGLITGIGVLIARATRGRTVRT
ncbi:MAG: hypothetical protein ACXWEN_12575, partial [Actinomycetota bacterium]